MQTKEEEVIRLLQDISYIYYSCTVWKQCKKSLEGLAVTNRVRVDTTVQLRPHRLELIWTVELGCTLTRGDRRQQMAGAMKTLQPNRFAWLRARDCLACSRVAGWLTPGRFLPLLALQKDAAFSGGSFKRWKGQLPHSADAGMSQMLLLVLHFISRFFFFVRHYSYS
jgi:hypothetical protein